MRLLTWNIRHGGGARCTRIVEEVSAYDADIIAFTEFRQRPGIGLRAALRDRGWAHFESTAPEGNENGIAIFARIPLITTRTGITPSRWLDIDLPDYGFGFAVLHIPAAGSAKNHPTNIAKTCFWNAVIQAAKARLAEPVLLVGDWNTGIHFLDEKRKTFVCSEHFAQLSQLGWTDMWRHHNRDITEFTWYSILKGGARGNGFRLDHAFASPSLRDRICGCRYSHAERDAGVSDHSIMIVDIE